ncbi:DUF1572 family protein [Flagellimonas flava]|uniref:DUF1572 domain-containing protein n=1 Tax=Flagellimonas flava TaxID=570519 RepID=A0A1M5P536_9FLAO|nr:DUF1572 family protein [Allomuricauda flava]SHG96323.1 Protein of unknown function [Allomuricauda flava]
MSFQTDYMKSVRFEFERYKSLGEKTFAQLTDEEIHRKYADTDNSIAIIVKHMVGNMLSRWTNFLTEDGEKTWRDREMEFEAPYASKPEMLAAWKNGWDCLFEALDSVNASNFNTKVKIRNQEHSIIEAVNRQLAHYSSHVGQLVFLGKMIKGKSWISLSIPKGGSEAFNRKMFG